jgi:hypothetical protein
MAFDPTTGRSFLYGGFSGASVYPRDTWAWDGATWTRLNDQGPTDSTESRLVFDGSGNRLVLIGKIYLSVDIVAFHWNGQGWTQDPPPPSSISVPGANGYDPVRQRLIHFFNDQYVRGCNCYADCDHSTSVPVLNVADFICFMQHFAAADPYANCDGSTQPPVLNIQDFLCFQQRFAAGCP